MTEQGDRLSAVLTRRFADLRVSFGSEFFTTRQANDIGVSFVDLGRLVRADALVNPVRGVYRSTSVSDCAAVEDRAKALSLVLPKGGAIGRRTAAWLFGVDPRTPEERDKPVAVECVVPRDRHPVHRPAVRCYQTDLRPFDLVLVAGVTCTSPTRTAADLLRWDRPHMGLAIVDALAACTDVEPLGLSDCLSRWSGERNIRQARRLAEWVEPLSESFGESWLRLRILEAGFPRPTAQIPVHDEHGRLLYRLDLGWPDLKLAVEYDGLEYHSGPGAQVADARRRRDLARRFGWHVVGVGKGEVLGSDLRLERGIGELLGRQPLISRRRW